MKLLKPTFMSETLTFPYKFLLNCAIWSSFFLPHSTSLQIEFIWRDQTSFSVTSPFWVKFVLRRPAHFLTDGQHLEGKTTALALNFYKLLVIVWGLVKWPRLSSEIKDLCRQLHPKLISISVNKSKQTCKFMGLLCFLPMS